MTRMGVGAGVVGFLVLVLVLALGGSSPLTRASGTSVHPVAAPLGASPGRTGRAAPAPTLPPTVAGHVLRAPPGQPPRLGSPSGPVRADAPPTVAPLSSGHGSLGLVAPAAAAPAGRAHASGLRSAVKSAAPVSPTATVAVGRLPTGIAVSATRAYVANSKDGTVSVIDTTANPMTIVATIPVGIFPVAVALSADGSQAYVTNFNGNSLSVISTSTNTVARTVMVGDHPDGVVVSGTSAYVANLLSASISVVDPAAGTVTATINLGGTAAPSGLAAGGGRLYANDARNGKTFVVDLGTNSVLGSVASGTRPAYLSLSSPLAYVASPGSNSVNLLNTTTTPPTAGVSILVGTAPYGVVAAPMSKLVLATNSGTNNLSVINSVTNAVIGAPTVVGTTPDAIVLSPDGTTAFVTNEASNTVSVLHVNQPPSAGAVSFSGAVGNTVFGVGTTPTAPATSTTGSVLSNSTDPEGDPLTVIAGSGPTAHGGSVAVNADGTFIYTPPVGYVGDDTFSFTVSDGGPATSTATATIHVVNRVWYVKNNDPGANDGRSISPFHTLGQAQTASSTGDYIYVFKGDGTSAGQSSGIALKANQHLVGEAQSLIVAGVTLFSVTPTVACATSPASCPQLASSGGSVVSLAGGTTVAGLALNPSGSAHGISGDSTVTSGATVDNVNVNDTGSGEGLILVNSTGTVALTKSSVTGGTDDAMVVSGSSGTLAITITNDTFSEPNTNGNDALNITTTASATVNPTISNTAFTAARGDLFQLNIGEQSSSTLSFMNNTLSNSNTNIVSGGGGFTLTAGGGPSPTATLNFDIQHNTFRDSVGNAVIIGNATGANTMKGTFSNNTVGVQGIANSGSLQGSDLSVAGVDGGSIGITAENNNLYQYNNFGATFQTTSTFPTTGRQGFALNVKFDNNTISNPGNNAPGFFGSGFQLNSGTTSGDNNPVCFDASANKVASSGFGGGFDIKLRQRMATTVRLPGFGGGASPAPANFEITQNSPPTPTAVTTGTFGGGGPCTGL